ncbi:MAG: SCP2 sterol-binding domain-containing protein [Lachnospiraceae bacterium]|nr:SCP2 sterol-binding domain-containing protein [Lachnospiraceae bacterium]
MKINIYYGGRGLIEDPTIYVMNKIQEVLKEIRVDVTRYNLYEQKNGISMLPNTMKDADAVILAVSVEWFGIGGLMQSFLDACWLYADKNKIKKTYMFPLVISTTRGEREAMTSLADAWEILGGIVGEGLCAYVENRVDFEANSAYTSLIEKKAEEIYRIVSHKTPAFPSSTNACGQPAAVAGMELTPQESEQLSVYVSDDSFVKKQKEDVQMLSQLYKNILDKGKDEDKQEFLKGFRDAFKEPSEQVNTVFSIHMSDTNKTIVLEVKDSKLNCYYGEPASADVYATATRDTVNKLVAGKITFQGGFMTGQITCKGDFRIMRNFDQLFRFE